MGADPADTTPTGTSAALRCSGFARSEVLDPVGSAGSYRGIVLAEVPLPWPRGVIEHAMLAGGQSLVRIEAEAPCGRRLDVRRHGGGCPEPPRPRLRQAAGAGAQVGTRAPGHWLRRRVGP
jgi:ABC-type phosphonate transport system ATPase subunit